jgi:hypothetical protein
MKRPSTSLLPTPSTAGIRAPKNLKSETKDPEVTFSKDFTSFKSSFQGRMFRFLKKDNQILVKLDANRMCVVKHDYVAIFDLDEQDRVQHFDQLQKKMEEWNGTNDFVLKNPFAYTYNEEGKANPIFIPISTYCTYYDVTTTNDVVKGVKPPTGKCFSGRLALAIKGVKYIGETGIMSPVLTVVQLLKYPQLVNECEVDKAKTTYVLGDEIDANATDVKIADGKHACESCDRKFVRAQHLERHVRLNH